MADKEPEEMNQEQFCTHKRAKPDLRFAHTAGASRTIVCFRRELKAGYWPDRKEKI